MQWKLNLGLSVESLIHHGINMMIKSVTSKVHTQTNRLNLQSITKYTYDKNSTNWMIKTFKLVPKLLEVLHNVFNFGKIKILRN